jgi:hypothetical protein
MTVPDQHPTWCAREGCATRGWHASARLLVHADDRTTGQDLQADQPAAALRLVQLLTASDAEPHLALTGGDLDDRTAMLLSVRQSRVLRRLLLRLVQEAESTA